MTADQAYLKTYISILIHMDCRFPVSMAAPLRCCLAFSPLGQLRYPRRFAGTVFGPVRSFFKVVERWAMVRSSLCVCLDCSSSCEASVFLSFEALVGLVQRTMLFPLQEPCRSEGLKKELVMPWSQPFQISGHHLKSFVSRKGIGHSRAEQGIAPDRSRDNGLFQLGKLFSAFDSRQLMAQLEISILGSSVFRGSYASACLTCCMFFCFMASHAQLTERTNIEQIIISIQRFIGLIFIHIHQLNIDCR